MSDPQTRKTKLDKIKGRTATALFRLYAGLGWTTGHLVDLMFFARLEWRVVRRFLAPKRRDLALDIACGGMWANRMDRTGACIIGLDLDFESLRYASGSRKPTSHVRYVCADATAMPFWTASFDMAFSICSLEHFSDDRRALNEMAWGLKPSASAALTVDSLSCPNGFTREELALHAKKHNVLRCYSLPELSEKVVTEGFRVDDSTYIVNSPISNYFFKRHALWVIDGHENRISMLFPFVYPIALISDLFFAVRDLGHIFAVKIRRNPDSHALAFSEPELVF